MVKKTQIEREAQMTGYVRNLYKGTNNIHSEETRIVRPYGNAPRDPVEAAVAGEVFMKKKNDHLAQLYQENRPFGRQILTPNIHTKVPLAQIPHPESSWAELLKNIPNKIFDKNNAKVPLEDQHYRYTDPFGHAGANPEHGVSYVWPNYLYYGNPWGVGGQLFTHLRQGGQINDDYLYPAKNNTHFLNK